MIWLLIGYMWLFVHRPYEIWPVLGTFHVERIYMIVTLACWLVRGAEMPKANRMHWCFLAFILAMLASWAQSPFPGYGDSVLENYLKYAVFYLILVSSIRTSEDLYRILVGYVAVMGILMAHSLREYLCGRVMYAQGIARLQAVGTTFDSNDLSGLIVASMPIVWVLWRRWPDWSRRTAIVAYIILSGVCVVLSGSRMGFIGMILAGLMATLASKRRMWILPLYPLLLAGMWSVLPQEKQDRFMTLLDPSRGPKNAVGSAGNFRFSGFEQALPLFADRPVCGYGPQTFGMATGRHLMPHNLYGQLLAELGLVGAIAFCMIVWGVVRNTSEARQLAGILPAEEDMLPWHTVMASSAALLLLLIMAWGFNFLYWHVWLWFGGFQVVALCCMRDTTTANADLEDAESQYALNAGHDCTEPEPETVFEEADLQIALHMRSRA
jgi:O-antigen ligase